MMIFWQLLKSKLMRKKKMSRGKNNLLNSFVLLITLVVLIFLTIRSSDGNNSQASKPLWSIQSIDTMKYSRDTAAEKLNDKEYDSEIETQVANIAKTGATHVGIATPYDERFLPFLKRWVAAARKNNLKIWYRGNWSNWEGWFGFERKMAFDEHINKSVEFIKKHPELFENGDSFTACPECENGAQGDPRSTGKVLEYRNFLIRETEETKKAFASIDKDVSTNWLSMNGDVANLIMDRETVKKTGGVISIDHYVRTPQKLVDDVDKLVSKTGAKIFFGEFGAPIPDIHGQFNEEEQAKWVDEALKLLSRDKNVIGVNYWTNKGGSTEAWNPDNSERKVVAVLTKYFKPTYLYGEVKNQAGFTVGDVKIKNSHREFLDKDGKYNVGVLKDSQVEFSKDGFETLTIDIDENSDGLRKDVILREINPSWYTRLVERIRSFFK